MKTVKKALIPVAGFGTRFLPVTKVVPKELLPIVDCPLILLTAEELVDAGIEQLILVTSENKKSIEDFFKPAGSDLLAKIKGKASEQLLERVDRVSSKLEIISVPQNEALGLGHAVGCGREAIGNEPFAVLLGDEIHYTPKNQQSDLQRLMNLYQSTSVSCVTVMAVAKENVNKYGIIESSDHKDGIYYVTDVVEKPDPELSPSRLALPGRYVFSPEIFDRLKEASPGKNGEIQLTDSMAQIAKGPGLLAILGKSQRYDAGDKLGYLKANVEFALRDTILGHDFKNYLENLLGGDQ